MTKNPFDNPDVKKYLDHAQTEMLPMMEQSAICLSINSTKPDAKQCLEIGAAILLDKPIILLVPDDTTISANLKRCASTIIHGSPTDPKVQKEIQAAIKAVLKNDRRAK